jgi:hypothetical protein
MSATHWKGQKDMGAKKACKVTPWGPSAARLLVTQGRSAAMAPNQLSAARTLLGGQGRVATAEDCPRPKQSRPTSRQGRSSSQVNPQLVGATEVATKVEACQRSLRSRQAPCCRKVVEEVPDPKDLSDKGAATKTSGHKWGFPTLLNFRKSDIKGPSPSV